MARSDFITPAALAPIVVSDIAIDFALNPVTDDVSRLVNETAIAQALRLTLLTYSDEWPFEPDNGTLISRSLFEPADSVTYTLLSSSIEQALRNQCSAFARVVGVQVLPRQDQTTIDILIGYSLIPTPSQVSTVRVVLSRAR